MMTWFNLPEKTRANVFNQVSGMEGLPANVIEKDWWVTLTLQIAFSLPCATHLIFKGGTSLSKGWDLINRFSEDIDLAIDRSFLGYNDPLSRTQVSKLRKASRDYVQGEFLNDIQNKINELGIVNVELSIPAQQNDDPCKIELHYQSLIEPSPYILPRVQIEVGARSMKEPVERRMLQSLVGKNYDGQAFADTPIIIPTVLPKRTFLEKAFLLHEEFQKPSEDIRSEKLSRHLYDLEKLMDTDHGREALQDYELYQSIVEHRRLFFTVGGVDYRYHQPDTIDFIPPSHLIKNWENDYQKMKEQMIFGESLKFKDLILKLEVLRERFRGLSN